MAINFSKTNTFAPNTTISSSEVNANFDEISDVFTGLEAKTTTFSDLRVDNTPTANTDVAIKSYVDNQNGIRLPNLSRTSATTIDVENNTGAANQTTITFRDGTQRSVTEDTGSAHKYRRFDITATAEFTSGTEDSGLYTGISETNNTWYAIYAVQSQIDSTKFVLVGTTTIPTQGNIATLNTNFGSGKWQYLGMIRNGDNAGVAGDLIGFGQHGPIVIFQNQISNANLNSGLAGGAPGIRLATTASATSLTYTHAAGTGAAQVPSHLKIALYKSGGGGYTGIMRMYNDAATIEFGTHATITASQITAWMTATLGVQVDESGATATGWDILLSGYIDGALGGGLNPLR